MAFYCQGGYTCDETFEKNKVVKARNRETGEIVALKRWRKELPEAQCEIDTWKKMYPEQFICAKEDGDFVFLVHKWINGNTFFDEAGSKERDPMDLAEELLEALAEFHEKMKSPVGDLKPENVIVDGTKMWLIDFETSSMKSPMEGIGGRKTLCFATRAYTAPEVYHGELTPASDIYSFGMMFLFAKRGSTSFEALDDMEECERAFVLKCTAKDANERFKDGKEALKALRQLKRQKSALSPKLSPPKRSLDSVNVENMNVTAHHISYGAAAVREPEVKYETPAEKSKIYTFPTRRESYRRLIIYVPGNITFAAEMAYLYASMYDMNTVLFDINDYDVDQVKYHLPLNEKIDIDNADESAGDILRAETWKQKGLIRTCSLCERLDVAMSGILAENDMAELGVRNISVWCYSNYDIAILSDSSRLNAPMSLELMRYSDYVVVPVGGDVDVIEAETLFYKRYFREMKIPSSKLKFVCWEYSEKQSVDHEAMVLTLGEDSYAGTISFDSRRHSSSNLFGSMYCETISPKIKSQYSALLGTLLFGKTKSA